MTYKIYIKNNGEGYDYENTCFAGSLDEAAKIFESKINKFNATSDGGDIWTAETLKQYIEPSFEFELVAKDGGNGDVLGRVVSYSLKDLEEEMGKIEELVKKYQ